MRYLKQDRTLTVLKENLGEIQMARKPVHGKHFDANVELFQSICKTASPHCELCNERRGFHIEQIV